MLLSMPDFVKLCHEQKGSKKKNVLIGFGMCPAGLFISLQGVACLPPPQAAASSHVIARHQFKLHDILAHCQKDSELPSKGAISQVGHFNDILRVFTQCFRLYWMNKQPKAPKKSIFKTHVSKIHVTSYSVQYKAVSFTPALLLRAGVILACQREDAPSGQPKIRAFEIIKPASNSH